MAEAAEIAQRAQHLQRVLLAYLSLENFLGGEEIYLAIPGPSWTLGASCCVDMYSVTVLLY